MLHYFINTSICWLASLVVYEIWLRKESFHQYNRIYLLTSLLIGMLLPLVNLNNWLSPKQTTAIQPLSKMYVAKKEILLQQVNDFSTPIIAKSNFFEQALWIIYLIGVVISLFFIIREAFVLIRLYQQGKKSTDARYTIIETGKLHTPFSFLHFIFVSNRNDYSKSQWTLVLTHEQEHSRQLHTADNLLLILLRIVIWFHPLLYVYFKKLRMIHEYQADEAAAINTTEYGTFLLEQNLLQGTPILAHSFNYSSIKNRIIMLTKIKSTHPRLLKYLAAFPLLLILLVCCTQTSFSGQVNTKGEKTNFKGNEIEFGEVKVIPFGYLETFAKQKQMFMQMSLPDSVPVKDYQGYLQMEAVTSDVVPMKINNKRIYGNEAQYFQSDEEKKYNPPVLAESSQDLDQYLFAKLKTDLDQLGDGTYILKIDQLVVDEKGNAAYYGYHGVETFMGDYEKKPNNKDELIQRISQSIGSVLASPARFKPASKNGKTINARLGLGNYQINVKNHQAKLVERAGC